MKFYKCDVCGKLIDKNDPASIVSEQKVPFAGMFGIVSNGKDICPSCANIGRTLDFNEIILDAWKNAVNTPRDEIAKWPQKEENKE